MNDGTDDVTILARRFKDYLLQQRNAFRLRSAGRELRVEFNNPNIGMFAQLNFCLAMARFTERTGQRLYIDLTSDNYRDPDYGNNWFDYFLEVPHDPNRRPAHPHAILSEGAQIPPQNNRLSIEEAHNSFFRAFGIRPDLAASVDGVARQLNIGTHTLGVHFRATDKHTEADLVAASAAIEKIAALVARHDDIASIFVASDDARFPKLVEERFRDLSVVYLDDSCRSRDERPVHLGGLRAGNYEMGRDAMLNALTLARCGLLLRTTSFLSAWASVFNPAAPVFLLNVPHADKLWFPESAIISRATLV